MYILKLSEACLTTYITFIITALFIESVADLLSEIRMKLIKLHIVPITNTIIVIRALTSTIHELSHAIFVILTLGKLKQIQIDVDGRSDKDIDGMTVSKQVNGSRAYNYLVDSLIGTAPLCIPTMIALVYLLNAPSSINFIKAIVGLALLFDTASDIDLGLRPNRVDSYVDYLRKIGKPISENYTKFYLSACLYQKKHLIKKLSASSVVYMSALFTAITVAKSIY